MESYNKINNNENLKADTTELLRLPERLSNPESDLSQNLGTFLIKKGFIQDIELWENSWGQKYEDKKIFINHHEMSRDNYNHYIFRLGVGDNNEYLFPKQEEVDSYRFLHETSHAYQDYLMQKESLGEGERDWYNKAANGVIDSNFQTLFQFCLNNRLNNKSLSTWGNVPDYNSIEDKYAQQEIRAVEDANELVTMYLWHPNYLNTFLDYLSLNIIGYNSDDVALDGLSPISDTEKDGLLEIVKMYINEMKDNVMNS